MTQQIRVQQIGGGFIVRGYTAPYANILKTVGATWDATKLWWHIPGKELPGEVVALVVGTTDPVLSTPPKKPSAKPAPTVAQTLIAEEQVRQWMLTTRAELQYLELNVVNETWLGYIFDYLNCVGKQPTDSISIHEMDIADFAAMTAHVKANNPTYEAGVKFAERIRRAHDYLTNKPAPAVKSLPPTQPDKRIAKWRKSADGLQKQIDHLHRPFGDQNVTRKRQNEYDSRLKEGDRLKKQQHALRAFADALERGELPEVLAKVSSNETIAELVNGLEWRGMFIFRREIETLKAKLTLSEADTRHLDNWIAECKPEDNATKRLSYSEFCTLMGIVLTNKERLMPDWKYGTYDRFRDYDRRIENGLFAHDWFNALQAVQALIAPSAAPVDNARKLESLRMQAARMSIEGYFPTPPGVISRMLNIVTSAFAHAAPSRVLEPSAGSGELVKAIRQHLPAETPLDVLEIVPALREILTLEGLNVVGEDFLAYAPGQIYSLAIMNPPFERMADTEHVRHAYDLLVEGGLLVSVMSPGWQTRRDKKAEAFREWLDNVGGEAEALPDGSFKTGLRSTGVSTCLVTIRK